MSESLSATIEERTLPAEQAIAAAAADLDAPQDRPLPGFEPPPYDAAAWNRRLASKQRAVLAAKAAWKAAAEKAAGLKKTWERETDEQDELYRVMDHERRQAEGELVQPSLRPVASGPQSSDCRYSQETGEACPGCILLRKAGAPLPDPEDTEHATAVRAALAEADDREELFSIVTIDRELNVRRDAVHAWSEDEAREVALWSALNPYLPEDANRIPTPAVLQPATNGAEPTTEQVMADAKVCLCGDPDFLVPLGSDDEADAKCTKCQGGWTGERPAAIRFEQAPETQAAADARVDEVATARKKRGRK